MIYFVVRIEFFIENYYCGVLFGCDQHGIHKSMAVLLPVYIIGDILFILFGAFILRLTHKYIQAIEIFHKQTISVETILTPIEHFLGRRLPIWRKYFLCCRKIQHIKEDESKPLFRCDLKCSCCCVSRGTLALIILIFFVIWIITSIIICGSETDSKYVTQRIHGYIPTYCALFDLTLGVFKSMGP